MINRDLIRRKIVQLTYAYYQNSDHNMENAEKELMFSLSKSYDLYNYMLQLIVAITQEARKRYDVDVARAKREGEQEPSPRFAFNKFALQLEENKMLLEWIDVKHSNWDEDIEMVRKVYTAITSSDLYADYVSGAIDEELADLDEYSRDREVWRRIYKQFIQNNENLDAFLEEKSLYWNDDKDIIDTFVLKTIKRFDPETKAKQELLPEYKDAEDRQIEMLAWKLLARVAMRTAMAQTDKSICLNAMRLLLISQKFLGIFAMRSSCENNLPKHFNALA